VSTATISVFRPSKLAADVVFSATGLAVAAEIWRRLKKEICDPYRPELHYMRGPGPKWREKHAPSFVCIEIPLSRRTRAVAIN
jgi:hypothetical protein